MRNLFAPIIAICLMLVVTSCDDYNKRDTPTQIEHTTWSSVVGVDSSTEDRTTLKFYTETCDLICERFVDGKLTRSTTQSGNFTYRIPKVSIIFVDGVQILGIVTSRTMLLNNGLQLEWVN